MTTPSAPPDNVRLYPCLDTGINFRLSEISNIRNTLQDEATKRARARRRYKTAYTSSYALNTGVCVITSATTAGAIGSLCSGIGAPAALPLGIISLAASAVGLVGATAQKILLKKLEKHDRILTLAEAKLATIDRLVSRALKDDDVSDSEFEEIQREMSDFRAKEREIQLKIRASANTDLDRLKKDLLEKGRQQGLSEAKQALNERS